MYVNIISDLGIKDCPSTCKGRIKPLLYIITEIISESVFWNFRNTVLYSHVVLLLTLIMSLSNKMKLLNLYVDNAFEHTPFCII